MPTTDETLSIAEVAKRTGLTTHALRYYERAGLMLHEVDRGGSTHRRYVERDVLWIEFLTKLRSTSMPISRIRDYVELARLGESTHAARLELLQRHRIVVAAHLVEVEQSLASIDYKISFYSERITNA